MLFNIEYGGGLVDFSKTVEAIERAAPDVVLIEEAWGQIPRLAQALGWSEYDVRHQVLARRPLLDPMAGDGRFLYAELGAGCVVALANVHLPSDPEPPDRMADAAVVAAAMDVERRGRLRALAPTLDALRPLLAAGQPAILGGDFNAPSHLDDPRPWPVSQAIAQAGLRDVWREAHPNPASRPGYTWWAARPRVDGWNPSPEARQTRIDQIHAGGAVRVKDARIVGEAGREGVDIAVAPWPSDHRAVLATLEIKPAATPTLVTAWPARVKGGEPLRVRARGFETGARLVLAPAGVDPATLSASREAGPADMVYATADLSPGAHLATLLDAAGRVLSTATFWVASSAAKPTISVENDRVKTGAPIAVRWTEAPGSRWDWIGVYPDGVDPSTEHDPLVWRHTRAVVVGSLHLDATAEGEGWPLRPGAYRVHLFEDDAYLPLASAPLFVEP
jgi:endonuclease/exonuclease/phosphatase family metal-dependent hydrolase